MVVGQTSPPGFYIRRDVTIHRVGQQFCTLAIIHSVEVLIDVEELVRPKSPRLAELLSQGREIGLAAAPRDGYPYRKC